MLAVNPAVPAKNVTELVAWIKANPDKAAYASSGPGSSLHMAAELFMRMSKTKMQHVPYKGSSAAHPDLLAMTPAPGVAFWPQRARPKTS